MRNRWLWILLGLSVALNVAFVGGFVYARFLAPQSVAVSGPEAAAPVVGPPVPVAQLVRELALDDEQRRRLRTSLQEMRRAAAPRVREQLALRDAVVAELRKPQPDTASIDRSLERAGALRSAVQKDVLRISLQFAATLRPDQQERFREIIVARTLAQAGLGARQRREGPAAREDRPRQ
jgi:uncharacterized membrane protein